MIQFVHVWMSSAADVCSSVLLPMLQSSPHHPDVTSWRSVVGCVLEERSEQQFLEALLKEMAKRKLDKTEGINVLETLLADSFWESSSVRFRALPSMASIPLSVIL